MFVWPDGSVTGSVRWAELEDIVARRDHESVTEAGWARLGALLAERSGAAQPSADEGDQPDDDDPYSNETAATLRQLLSDRGLPTSGKKAELAERLREDDAAEVEQDEPTDDDTPEEA